MAINLRTLFSNDVGVDIEADILSDEKLDYQWTRAINYWFKYMLRPEKYTGITVGSGLVYTFTDPIPYSIVSIYKLPEGLKLACSQFYYATPLLTVEQEGQYSIVYRGELDITLINDSDLPPKLRDLFVNYAKRASAQFLKFANYEDKPFEVDAQAWFDEATTEIKDLEEFIMINHDDRIEDLSNFQSR